MQITTRALVYSSLLTAENLTRSTSRTFLVTLEWIKFGCVHKIYPVVLNRIARLF